MGPAFLKNIPFFLVPFWAASLLLSRPREMPIIPADKVNMTCQTHWNAILSYRNTRAAPATQRLTRRPPGRRGAEAESVLPPRRRAAGGGGAGRRGLHRLQGLRE